MDDSNVANLTNWMIRTISMNVWNSSRRVSMSSTTSFRAPTCQWTLWNIVEPITQNNYTALPRFRCLPSGTRRNRSPAHPTSSGLYPTVINSTRFARDSYNSDVINYYWKHFQIWMFSWKFKYTTNVKWQSATSRLFCQLSILNIARNTNTWDRTPTLIKSGPGL